MGVLYEKSDKDEEIRRITSELKEKILTLYYWKHHKKFSNAINKQLESNRKALIVDCHSFPSIPLKRDLDKRPNRPDFNIGSDDYHTPKNLVDFTSQFFNDKGYSVGVDYPYLGKTVPMSYYKKDGRIHSIMVEINRKLYLKVPTNEKSENFLVIKKIISTFLQAVKEFN